MIEEAAQYQEDNFIEGDMYKRSDTPESLSGLDDDLFEKEFVKSE